MKIVLSLVLAMFLVSCSEENASHKVTKDSLKAVKEEVKKDIQKVTKTEEKKKIVEEKVEVKKKKIAQTSVVVTKVDGAKIFAKCVSCHGKTAEKKALNKSQIIRGWSSAKTITALKGYKNGTYGSSMKGVMKSQAAKLSDAEMEAVAKYIAKL